MSQLWRVDDTFGLLTVNVSMFQEPGLYMQLCTGWSSCVEQFAGSLVVFHDTSKSPYSRYELTFHQSLTFIVLFLTYGEQLISYYAKNL